MAIIAAKQQNGFPQSWRPSVSMPPSAGTGGSIPIIGEFKRRLGCDALLVGFARFDNRVHSPNEKCDLSSFHKGIRSWVRILAAFGDI
ncbi:hypothetical protein GA0061102_1002221 [Rhizobium miluonense]|uniref:Peptidase family M20/M25/M40 n=1 Tax=Rhizobium miluonense TaxID=411945 RepID=A0A1C3U9T3_9HYPH|nr:hypothetical protein GA0061102_1002221 [Rhizobium miluonense]